MSNPAPPHIATNREQDYITSMVNTQSENGSIQHGLQEAIVAQLADNHKRVTRFEHQGQTIWLKRPEKLTSKRRLQKGNADSAFQRELEALRLLNERGAPVPELLSAGEDYFAVANSGVSLNLLLNDATLSDVARQTIFRAAGRALADLHNQGLSHGRPNLKDICWDGERIRFIDFERFDEKRNSARGHAQDLIIFLLNAFSFTLAPRTEIDAAIEGYLSHDQAGIWARARAKTPLLRLINWLTKPVQWKRRGAREFKAIPHMIAALNDVGPADS